MILTHMASFQFFGGASTTAGGGGSGTYSPNYVAVGMLQNVGWVK